MTIYMYVLAYKMNGKFWALTDKEKLREVMARKWIINEAPIFVGIYNGDKLVI